MKKTALRKTSWREIRGSITRFLSIVGIIFLGVSFFIGLSAAGPDMLATADYYYDKKQLADDSVISSLGFLQSDLKALKKSSVVDHLEGRHFKDINLLEKNQVVRIVGYSNQQKLNAYQITEGKMPKKDNEILLDSLAKERYGFQIGDDFLLTQEDDLDSALKTHEYKVVGFAKNPRYIENFSRGNTDLGKGSIDYFAVIPDSNFKTDVFSEILVTYQKTQQHPAYSKAYDEAVSASRKKIKPFFKEQGRERFQQIQEQGNRDLTEAKKQLEQQKRSLSETETALATARLQISDLIEQQKQLTETTAGDNLTQQIQQAEANYQIKQDAYYQQKPSVEEELEKAEDEIKKQENQLRKMSFPHFMYQNRQDNPGYGEYQDNAERVSSLATVFPVIFFLIAALVTLTTMTRMIEEKRLEIGMFKALGYRSQEIAKKYLLYSFLAGGIGCLLGLAVGFYLLPTIIFNAYGQLYNVANFKTLIQPKYLLIAICVALLCSVGTAMLVLRADLKSTPAVLMRPKAPKAGKRILLEHIRSIWNRLSFTQKVTMRNLFRYKQRMFMTILGIAGCMAMIITGFGLRDSIGDILTIQFNKLWHYQGTVVFNPDATTKETERYEKQLQKLPDLDDHLRVSANAVTIQQSGQNTQDVTLYVPQKPNQINQFILFDDRKTGERYSLTEKGGIINEKLADLFGIKVGDELKITESERTYRIKIAAVSENYVGHFIYLTPDYYKNIFKKEPIYNADLLKLKGNLSEKSENAIAENLMELPKVGNVNFLSQSKDALSDTIDSLNIIVWVLIVSAGLLAFIVLYNLTNINVSERIRELSTIKVLGFFDREVVLYVYRENIILMVFGILLGLVLGKVEHRYVLKTVEVDLTMFSPEIHTASYVYSILLTILFTLIVGIIMYFKLKKIDMIEALKANE